MLYIFVRIISYTRIAKAILVYSIILTHMY
uniref:Uncharacterized protein n=1 Tax=Dulem virus 36 TaxID=3145754 RepID=A0AAU8B0F6_9CAUD